MTAPPANGVAPIVASGVGKRYLKYADEAMLTSRRARLWSRTSRSHHWAIRGLDLEVGAGECLGLIGRNGSGKSTLLRMIAGVTAPTEGKVSVRGRVAPLIAVGVGFHPELTGRENVYVNGSILGVPRRVIDARFDDIVDFAGIEEFIDTPVKFYSSGMFVRLGFGVSMFAEPDVLLVDEVLAVGDLGFQMKCFDRMERVRENGTAIIVVSHNLNAIRMLCRTTLLLDDGSVAFLGDTAGAISRFHEVLGEARELEDPDTNSRFGRDEGVIVPLIQATQVDLHGPDGQRTRHISSTDEVTFVMDAELLDTLEDPIIGLFIYNFAGLQVYCDSTIGTPTGSFREGAHARFTVSLQARLVSGSFTAVFHVATADGALCLRPHTPLSFEVAGSATAWGMADLGGRFEIDRR